MRKVHAALKPGGRAAIAELVPNPDRVSPPTAAAFSMTMLATTPAGDAYTFAEFEGISKSAGFTRVGLHLTRLSSHEDTGAHEGLAATRLLPGIEPGSRPTLP
jgi:hypothetical protein